MLVAIAFLLPFTAQAKSWRFSHWNTTLRVQADSSVVVEEWQTFVFDGDFSWVTRDLPKSKGILYREISVTDEQGNILTGDAVDIDNKQTSARIQVNFSASDEERTWVFRYTVDNAIGYFDTYDELYWNVVSTDRDVPIDAASAAVVMPRPVDGADTRQRLFLGPVGSTNESSDYHVTVDGTMSFFVNEIAPQDAFTIVAGWPKGVVTETHVVLPVPPVQRILTTLFWPFLTTPLIVFIVLFRRWKKFGRDPKGRGTIVPQYEPPDKAQPAVMGSLLHESATNKELAATIVDMAVRGYLVIEEIHEGLFRKESYAFSKKKEWSTDQTLVPFERDVLKHIFNEGDRVTLNELKKSFYEHVPEIKKAMMESTTARGYFTENPDTLRKRFLLPTVLSVAFIIAFIGLTGMVSSVGTLESALYLKIRVLYVAIFAVNLILYDVFAAVMPRRTTKGVAAKEWTEGFKLYLHTAERFRIAAMKPETFERFLPYAMVLGVEKEWAEKFKDICTEPPSWYVGGPTGSAFHLVAFTSGFSHAMNTSVASALATSPSSSSGFGGGGFSGGGGGGGGSGAG